MNNEQKKRFNGITIEQIQTKLSLLRQVKVPEALKEKLIASIPCKGQGNKVKHLVWNYRRAFTFTMTAAAALIFFFVIVSNFQTTTGLKNSMNQPRIIAGLNDVSPFHARDDQNSTVIVDINQAGSIGQR